jgi:hypothetical protein
MEHVEESCRRKSSALFDAANTLHQQAIIGSVYHRDMFTPSDKQIELRNQAGTESDLSTNIREAVHTLWKDIHGYINKYSGPECLALCDEMQAKLPREIRDNVYEHVLGERVRSLNHGLPSKIAWKVGQKPNSYSGVGASLWMRELLKQNILHLLDNEVVGFPTVHEFAETYYRYSNFTIHVWFSSYELERAFEGPDLWRLGINVGDMINSLEFLVGGGAMEDLVTSIRNTAEQLGVYCKHKKDSAKIKISMDCRRIKPSNTGKIAILCNTSFGSLNDVLAADEQIVIETAPGHEFKVKYEKLNKELWLEMVQAAMW